MKSLLTLLILVWATAVSADDATAPADSLSPLLPDSTASDSEVFGDYLDTLSTQTDDAFGLDALSISDAEIDSLIRVWEETGEAPTLEALQPRLRFDWSAGGIRYNRVEGLNVMPELRIELPTEPRLLPYGAIGYGFASKEITWRAGINVRIREIARLTGGFARDVYAYGSGGIPGNSLTALTLGRDNHDYFLGEGWSAGLVVLPGRFRLAGRFLSEDQSSLAKETNFSLFERASFRANPSIDPGRDRRIESSVSYRRLGATRPFASARAVFARAGFGGHFDYDSFRATLRERRSLWFGDAATVELTGGFVTGDAPRRALHFLGGLAALRGYDINEFATREFVHGRLDYALGTDLFRWAAHLQRLRIQFVPFFEGAAVFEVQDPDGTVRTLDEPDVRFSTGIGLQKNVLGVPGGAGQLRVDVARRLDRGADTWSVWVGITTQR